MHGDLRTRSTLLLRLRDDDTMSREIAWDEFRSTYAPILAGFARKLDVKPSDCDDIIRDVMVGFFAHAPNFLYDPARVENCARPIAAAALRCGDELS
jgi:hypothetical protein